MDELLGNPLIQSAVVPFVVALIAAWVLRPAGGMVAGLGFTLAYAATVWLVMGPQITPLTSTRKLVLAGAGAVAFGLVAEGVLREHRSRAWILGAAAAGAALWLIWPRTLRLEGTDLWMMMVPALAYAAWLVGSMDTLNRRPVNLVVAGLALGVGTGVAAVLGASALLGQLGGAIGAAVGAYALLFLIRGEFAPRAGFSAPVALLSALVGLSAVIFARLPWYTLVPLALIPLLAMLPVPARWGVLARSLLVTLYTVPAAAVAIIVTWRVSGAPPL